MSLRPGAAGPGGRSARADRLIQNTGRTYTICDRDALERLASFPQGFILQHIKSLPGADGRRDDYALGGRDCSSWIAAAWYHPVPNSALLIDGCPKRTATTWVLAIGVTEARRCLAAMSAVER